jgi:alpha-2-macroglobulin-like protein
MSRVKVYRTLGFAIAGLCIYLAGSFALGGQVLPQLSTGSDRYLTHITTDKPIYRTGEKMYVRGVVLRAEGHTPGATGTSNYEIKGPKGDTVASGLAEVIDSVMGFVWDIPAAQAGGEYTVRITHPTTGDAPAERKFDIRAYRAPRLKSQIVFVRDGYGPGDTVGANLHVDRAEGGIPAGARVSVSARVDGAEVWKGETRVDPSGNASASFKLPASIARGEGTIAMIIEDGGTVETATKTIPILLQTIDIAIYPEGGDLVAGLTNRVYLEGRTPARKPADMAGVIVNRAGREVATFRTEHEGRGRFSFVPVKGETYSLRINEPAGIKTVFPLPAIKDIGVVIASASDVTPKEKDIVVRVAATADGDYRIALSQRGKELTSKMVTLKADRPTTVELTVPRTLDGVLVATVYDNHDTPMAERLLFRQSQHQLNVKVVADRSDYVPGDKVTLRVLTTDDKGRPVGALVGLTVTDSSVLEMIEKREQAPRLPVMVLLESDVKDLSDAHVYLDDANPKAPLATDLLLGTQGWRRFGTLSADKFLAAYTDAARRVLGNRMMTAVERAQLAARSNVVRDQLRVEAFAAAPAGAAAGRGGGPGAGGGIVAGVIGGVVRVAPVAAPPPAAQPKEEKRPDVFAANEIEADALMGLRKLAADRGIARQANMVREYAHTLRPGWTEGSRTDFTETVYWNAGVKTDAATGSGTISFNLSDSVTAFRVLADGVAPDGALGSSISHVESVQPFSIEAKMPLQVTSGDVIQLPVSMINGMSRELRGVQLSLNGATGIQFAMPGDNASLRPNERARRLVQLTVGRDFSGMADLTLDARAGRYADSVTRQLDVQPLGFPHQAAIGGVLESNGSKTFEFTLPREIVRGSVSSSVTVYPTPLASMTDALQSLLREPYGCFEQTSSTSYPMIMAQQYFLTHTGVDPSIIEKTRTLLESSYKKLTGFESKSKGYEWFGADPGHEALTAYGLLQFTDMAQVRSVDKDMLNRTRAWLLARRDGNGGFNRSAKAIDSFGGAPADTTNAYITWALIESGEKGLEKEVAAVKAIANATKDSYVVALGANILHLTGDRAGARQLMDKLVKAQDAGGGVNGAVTTITRSGGNALAIETTALSALAWMRESAYAENVQKSVRWIVESNKNGRFASTQSTVLALRTIVAYDAAHARPKAPGRILLSVDGKAVGNPIAFAADTQGAIVLPGFASELGPGKHTVMVKMEGGSSMPFSISVKHHSTLPDSSDQAQVGINVTLRDRQVQEGAVTEAVVSVTNKSNEPIPTPVAIVGIPGGLEVRHDQLKELVKSGKIDAYEVTGREVILYWRVLKADARFDIPLSVVAAVPGSYTGPASRAYLYYTDEYKNWAPGLTVSISPR